jgi:predicted ATP-grasp superfamily ATP-dependent carboligase
MRILVTDGDNRATLAIVRSLGQKGHHVVVGERRTPSLAQASCHCAGRVVYPDPFTNEIGFTNQLLQEIADRQIDVLLPVADVTTALVAHRREDFERVCRLPLADEIAIGRAADKVDVVKLASTLGVPVPHSVFVEHAGEAVALAPSFSYPVVIKPRRSRVRTDAGWRSCSVTYASNAEELVRRVHGWPAEAYPLILQERIHGGGVGVFLCMDRGEPVAVFSHRRLREKPPSGGVSVLCESVEARPDTTAHAIRLLRELGWQGIAMVEFKMDERDGIPKLMEINGRFWGSLQLAIDAGVDFPSILLDTCVSGSRGTAPAYRVGVRSRWLWGDFDALLLHLFGRQPVTAVSTGKVRHALQFMKLWGRDLHYENPRVSDLGPWLFETRQWFSAWSSSRSRASAVIEKARE